MLRTRRKQAAAKERLRNFIAKTTLENENKNLISQPNSTHNKAEEKDEQQLLCDKEKLNTNGGLDWTYHTNKPPSNTIVEYLTLPGLVKIHKNSRTWPFSPNFIQ